MWHSGAFPLTLDAYPHSINTNSSRHHRHSYLSSLPISFASKKGGFKS